MSRLKSLDDKSYITAVFGGRITHEFSPLQLVCQGKRNPCNFKFPEDWHITHSDNHWCNEQLWSITSRRLSFFLFSISVGSLMIKLPLQYLMSSRGK